MRILTHKYLKSKHNIELLDSVFNCIFLVTHDCLNLLKMTFKLRFLCLILSSICFDLVLSDVPNNPIVTVEQGKLRGAKLNLLDGSPYYSFKGIQYADVPLRFAPPAPPNSWDGIRDAINHGPVCTQYDSTEEKIREGSENCLFLNVYTKTLDLQAKKSVMVFIHGGSYNSGSGNAEEGFGPEFLLQHDVVFVTLNYRLEVLGFLCLDIPEVPGNAAMRDQVAAFRWVQKNIAQFGGDPKKVTIFGESSGATSVANHMHSPMSKGLFSKAILESGVSTMDYAIGTGSKERAFRVAKYLGKDSTDPYEVLEFLRSVPAVKLTNLTYVTMTEDEEKRGLPEHFIPVVEKKFKGVKPFLSMKPIDSLLSGKMNKVPLMLGYNSDESIIMLDDALSKLNFTNANPRYLVSKDIVARVTEDIEKVLGQRIKDYYSGGKDFTPSDTQEIVNMLSDRYFIYDIHRFAYFYSSLANTYLYKFSYSTELNIIKILTGHADMKGASHGDELFYLFYSPLNSDAYNNNTRLKDVVYRVTKLWTDFAKFGNPTPDNSLGSQWAPYTRKDHEYFEINEDFVAATNAEPERIMFWDNIYCETGLPCIANSCRN